MKVDELNNQKLLYDGLKNNAIQGISPRGARAEEFFRQQGVFELPQSINIERSIDFYVNDIAIDGYSIFKRH